jgi:hypothetical protein
LVSIAIVLMIVSTAGGAKFGNAILRTNNSTGFVDALKLPACGCDCGGGWHVDAGLSWIIQSVATMITTKNGKDNN